MTQESGRDFFISYTASDVQWAEWIAATLERAGYTVVFQGWDFHPGDDFVHLMHRATRESGRTIAVLSSRYFSSGFGEAEWIAAFAQDPLGEKGLLLPVRVEQCEPPGLLASRIFVDLALCPDERAARDAILAGVQSRKRARPSEAPYPGGSSEKDEVEDVTAFPPKVSSPGDAGTGTAERAPWDWLRRHRPKIAELSGYRSELLGHRRIQETIRARVSALDTAALVLLAGPAGSGKSSLTDWLRDQMSARVVDAGEYAERLNRPLREDGTDVGRLLRAMRPAVRVAGAQAVLIFDDVDHDLKEPGIAAFVQEAIAQLNLAYLVLTTSTPLTPQLFPIPVTELMLDRRRTEFAEFDRFLDRVLDAAGCTRSALSGDLRRSLHDMSDHTASFHAVQYVVEMLIAHHRWTGIVTHAPVLRRLLESDPHARRLELPAVRTGRGRHLSFRSRDKSELLAQILLRQFPTARSLAHAAEKQLEKFDADDFLLESEQSLSDAVVSLCLTYSPRDLVLMLEPKAIRQEIRARSLDPGELFDEQAEVADLLVRGLGFTLVDAPKGLKDFKDAVQATRALIDDGEARPKNVLNAAGKVVVHYVQSALLDLVHFWATYLFGSVHDLVSAANAERAGTRVIDGRYLRASQIVELLAFLNDSAQAEASTYRLSFNDSATPVSATLLYAASRFASAADTFATLPRGSGGGAGLTTLRERVEILVVAADDVLRASESSFPSVIKLSEIVFDEYSRKIFRGVDSDGNDVRFALPGDDDRDELVVAAHYFMLPKKRISVNPHIVRRGGSHADTLFDRAEAYDAKSTTQRRQADRLFEFVELRPEDSVIDVGSGTGRLTVFVGQRVRRVRGIDHSPEMVRMAQQRAEAAQTNNVTFELVDLLEYKAGEVFDVVMSNATMHWVLPAHRGYQALFQLLRRGGRLGVHQGGHGNYRGLHTYTRTLLKNLDLWQYCDGWNYPIYYPFVEDYRELLASIGFENISIVPAVSDGSEYPNLIQDFSEAGLQPYVKRLPEIHQESFRAAWLEDAADSALDLYTHRLYATASRP